MQNSEYEDALDELDQAEKQVRNDDYVDVPVPTWEKVVRGAGDDLPEDWQHWPDNESDRSVLRIPKKIVRRTVDSLRKGERVSEVDPDLRLSPDDG